MQHRDHKKLILFCFGYCFLVIEKGISCLLEEVIKRCDHQSTCELDLGNWGSLLPLCSKNVNLAFFTCSQKLLQGYSLNKEMWCWDYLNWVCNWSQLRLSVYMSNPVKAFIETFKILASEYRKLLILQSLKISLLSQLPGWLTCHTPICEVCLYLWSLPALQVRELVSDYTQEVHE